MKAKYILSLFLSLVAVVFILGWCTDTVIGKMIRYNFADIGDYRIFPVREIHSNQVPEPFPHKTNPIDFTKIGFDSQQDFEQKIEQNQSVAFLVIHKDSICYQFYAKKYQESSIVPSFSMAKSITSLLIGKAIEEGYIKNVKEPVTTYIPELRKNGFDAVTIEHVLQMTSGIDFNESYINPAGEAAQFYYGNNLEKAVCKLKLKNKPGEKFEYTSGNTQILGLILQRALKGKSITQYLGEKLWQPLAMQYPASWSLDRNDGLEKTFCCINACAVDYAKIGSLVLHQGNYKGKQIISKEWMQQSTQANFAAGGVDYYQYQWWLPDSGDAVMAEGILGQFIYVNPKKDLVIVRLGKENGNIDIASLCSKIARNLP